MSKVRLDRLVVDSGLAASREKARRLILAGEVLVNETPQEKPGALVARDDRVRLRNPPPPFAGRGGEKLAGALDELGLEVTGLCCLDVGASTGGFTDCLLQRGAAEVTAVDVGKGQLDWKLRTDPRVRLREGVNARYLRSEDFPERFDLITLDVSFISLSKILPAVAPLARENGRLLALVKPQFELSREEVDAGGVVRDPMKHVRALEKIFEAARQSGLAVSSVVASPITGMEGNREFFLLMSPKVQGAFDPAVLAQRARELCGLE